MGITVNLKSQSGIFLKIIFKQDIETFYYLNEENTMQTDLLMLETQSFISSLSSGEVSEDGMSVAKIYQESFESGKAVRLNSVQATLMAEQLAELQAKIDFITENTVVEAEEGEVLEEGIMRQLLGGAKDTMTMKQFRDGVKVMGLFKWKLDRIQKNVPTMVKDIHRFIDDAVKKHDLGKEVPKSALDSIIASSDSVASAFLLSDKHFNGLKQAIKDQKLFKPALSVFKNLFESFMGSSNRRLLLEKVKTYDDLKKAVSLIGERAIEVSELIHEIQDGKVNSVAGNQYIGLNAFVQFSGTVRSIVRRAI